jgi:hypothetical protein
MSDLEGQTGLADTRRTAQREQSRSTCVLVCRLPMQQGSECGQFVLATDERSWGNGYSVR